MFPRRLLSGGLVARSFACSLLPRLLLGRLLLRQVLVRRLLLASGLLPRLLLPCGLLTCGLFTCCLFTRGLFTCRLFTDPRRRVFQLGPYRIVVIRRGHDRYLVPQRSCAANTTASYRCCPWACHCRNLRNKSSRSASLAGIFG